MAEKNKVRIGIVGLGRLGKRHALNLRFSVDGAELVAAASPVADERNWAAQSLPGVEVFDSLAGLLRYPGLDAVWLVTPTSIHVEQIQESLAAGKHVFCEKPVSLTVDECDRVIESARKCADQTVMIGFTRRFDAAYMALKQKIETGDLGSVYRLHFESHDPIDPSGFFVKFAPTSGGLFLDCGIHDVDLARWFAGSAKAVRVSASGSNQQYPGLAECRDIDTGVGTIEFDNGLVATMFISRTSHRGYESTIWASGTGSALKAGFNIQSPALIAERDNAQHAVGLPDFFSRFEGAFLTEARAFVHAIQNGLPSPLTLEDAREATRLAIALREAYETHSVIELR
jgi:myo-inositol 2-dehydrogenase / D-chiro-inositol 1-dehydrogenase